MKEKTELEKKIDLWEGCYKRANEKVLESEGVTDMKELKAIFMEYQEAVKKAHSIFREIVEECHGTSLSR